MFLVSIRERGDRAKNRREHARAGVLLPPAGETGETGSAESQPGGAGAVQPGDLLPQADVGRPEEPHDGRGVCGPGGGDAGQDPDGQHDRCWWGGGGQDLGLQLPEVPQISQQQPLQSISVPASSS